MQDPVTSLRIHIVPDHRLDPDWGHSYPEAANAYVISVTSTLNGYYSFVLLLPDSKNVPKLVALVMKQFLNKGDSYVFRDFNDQDLRTYMTGGLSNPVLGFDPAADSEDLLFGWITPPIHLRH